MPPKGSSLIQDFSEVIESGEESAKELRRVEEEAAAQKKEIGLLDEKVQLLELALNGVNMRSVYILKKYFDTPPNEALHLLEEVEALTRLDANALQKATHMTIPSYRKGTTGKKKLPARTSSTDADAENTSSSSSPSAPKRHPLEAQDGFGSDELASCKEETEEPFGARYRGSGDGHH